MSFKYGKYYRNCSFIEYVKTYLISDTSHSEEEIVKI